MRLRPAGLSGLAGFLVSVLALLALSFPLSAQATEAQGVQYSDAPPTATGESQPKHQAPARSSAVGGGQDAPGSSGSTAPGSSGAGSSGEGSSSRDAGGSAAKGDGRGGTRQGSPGDGAGKNTEAKQSGDQVAAQQQGDDGSSPLVPILIAIALLAAISVALVTWQRRRGQGAETSVSSRAS